MVGMEKVEITLNVHKAIDFDNRTFYNNMNNRPLLLKNAIYPNLFLIPLVV